MRASAINCDQYKISMEARPLQILNRKCSPCGTFSQNPCVRPPGSVRRKRQRENGPGHPTFDSPDAFFPSTDKVNGRGGINMKLNRKLISSEKTFKYKCEQHGNVEYREREHSALPSVGLSRSQAFENKFRIAASRTNAGSPVNLSSPVLRTSKSYDKKIIHLPLFRINLKSYSSELDVTRTVASTRESLRKLMELHKAKMKNSNVITANIRNYEFSAPASACNLAHRTSELSSQPGMLSQPFQARTALRNVKREPSKLKYPAYLKQHFKTTEELESVQSENDNDSSKRIASSYVDAGRSREQFLSAEEPDDSMLSVAIRPDTSLTLGSTMHHIDRVFRSPGSEELRELNEVFKANEAQPAWPTVDEMQKMTESPKRNFRRSRTMLSRPCTVLENTILETPDCAYCVQDELSRPRGFPVCPETPADRNTQGRKSVLRYTSKQNSFKLDPVIVPSHTCTECPMCNLYTRECETEAPPNTPNTSHHQMEPLDTPADRLPLVRGTRLGARPEVLHLSRVNVNSSSGFNCDEEETQGLSYMEASG